MNLYVRYYDGEALVHSIEELIESLKAFGVPESLFDDDFIDEMYEFLNSKMVHPRRFRVTQRQYFILIKTNVESIEEFKANARKAAAQAEAAGLSDGQQNRKSERVNVLTEENPGWYEGAITFKRVIYSQRQGKYQYKDTQFRAQVKANSVQDCYNRIVDHLKNRQEVDPRSQFPSVKGRNFSFVYLGDSPTV